MKTVNRIENRNGSIWITLESTDGLGGKSYDSLKGFTISEAINLVADLNKVIDEALEYVKDTKEKRMKSLEQEIQMRIDELKKLKEG